MFINSIVWCYTGGTPIINNLQKRHDVILHYGFNNLLNQIYLPYKVRDPRNKNYDRGKPLEDWWMDISSSRQNHEANFPTQKPSKLLRRIICLSTV